MFPNPAEDRTELIARFETMLKGQSEEFFDSSSWEDIIDYYIRNMMYEKAGIAASMAIDIYPASSELSLLCAEAFVYEGDMTRAASILGRLEGIIGGNADFLVTKGIYLSNADQHTKAIECFLAAYADYDDPFQINVLLGEEYAAVKNLGMAAKYLEKAVLSNPSDAEAIARLADVYSYDQYYSQAVRFFNRLIDHDPYNADAWHNLGLFLAKDEKWDEAVRAYEYAILIDPQRAMAYYDLADIYEHREQPERVIPILKTLLNAKHTEDPYPYLRIAECYQNLDDFDNACEYFLKAVHYDPQQARGWYGLAAVHFESGFKKQALDYIRQGLSADSYDIDCLRLCWEIEESLDLFEDALAHLNQVIDHPESNAEDYLDLAYFMYQRGMPQRSLDILKSTRTLFPDAYEVFYHLCAIYCALGDRIHCMEMFDRAVRLAPDLIGVLKDNYPTLMNVDETNKKIYLT